MIFFHFSIRLYEIDWNKTIIEKRLKIYKYLQSERKSNIGSPKPRNYKNHLQFNSQENNCWKQVKYISKKNHSYNIGELMNLEIQNLENNISFCRIINENLFILQNGKIEVIFSKSN